MRVPESPWQTCGWSAAGAEKAPKGRRLSLDGKDRVGGHSRRSGKCLRERCQNPTAHRMKQSRKKSLLRGFPPASRESQGYGKQEFCVVHRLRHFVR